MAFNSRASWSAADVRLSLESMCRRSGWSFKSRFPCITSIWASDGTDERMALVSDAGVRTKRGFYVKVGSSIAVVSPRDPAWRRMAATQAGKLALDRAGMMNF